MQQEADGTIDDSSDCASDLLTIDGYGDLVLSFPDPVRRDGRIHYLVSSSRVKTASMFFSSLLDRTKFSEGARISQKLEEVRSRCSSENKGSVEIPFSEFPRIDISDIGDVPFKQSNKDVITFFLDSLHFGKLQSKLFPPISLDFCARLGIVADRFMAKNAVEPVMKRLHESRTKKSLGEVQMRQRILLAYLFDFEDWMKRSTNHLINHGSKRWIQSDNHIDETANELPGTGMIEPLWTDLPGGLEGTSTGFF